MLRYLRGLVLLSCIALARIFHPSTPLIDFGAYIHPSER